MNNNEKFRGPDFIPVTSNHKNGEEAELSEDHRERDRKLGNLAYNNSTPERRKASDIEKAKAKHKIKKIVTETLIGIGVGAALIGLASIDGKPEKGTLPKEEWTNTVVNELAGCSDIYTDYNPEGGSYFEMTKNDEYGNTIYYSFNDADTDGQPESGSASGERGVAEFNNEQGIPIKAAISRLDKELGN